MKESHMERPKQDSPDSRCFHMSPDEFRRHGHAAIEWLAQYMERVADFPVQATVAPGEVRQQIPPEAPEQPEPFENLLRDMDDVVLPGVTHWQSPNWFAYFPANVSPPAILGELLAAGLGMQGMLWATGPACTEIESAVLDWLVDLLGLPKEWKTTGRGGGVIQGSASDATLTALVTARHQASHRCSADHMVVYTSRQAHSSVEKGARVAGLGHLRLVDVDETYAMRPDALTAAIDADQARGLTPLAVASTVGTTGTTAVDPVRKIGEVTQKHGIWHHVDSAYAGTAMVCPEFRHFQDGLELVNSYTFNPHKWMFTNFDCSVFYVSDRQLLIDSLSIQPPYLRNQASDSGQVIDYRDWQIPLGRRFRALKLWFVLRSYGAEGIRHHVRQHVLLARELEKRLQADPRFVLIAPVPFALVCFAHVAGNAATEALAAALNDSGRVAVTQSRLDDRTFIRIAVGQTRTEAAHLEGLWTLLDRFAAP
jgi:aromatic-L-amino-acid decarboxylase